MTTLTISASPASSQVAPPPLAARIGAALSLWSRQRGDEPDAAIDDFSDLVAESRDPSAIEAALVRLAYQSAGPNVRQVELWRDAGWGPLRVNAWPPHAQTGNEPRGRTTEVDLPLRCGGQDRGTLRVTLDGPLPLDPERHRRLATLVVLAAAADRPISTTDREPAAHPTHDATTGLPNASFLDSFLTYALAMAERRDEPLSLLYIGVDRLAAIRDLHGPEIAGEALRKVGRTIAGTLRTSDLIARLDDGRLVAVLPGAAPDNARVVAESVRTAIAAMGTATRAMPLLTVSIGVGSYPESAASAPSLRSTTAAALADARSKGRDRVSSAPPMARAEPPMTLRIAPREG